PVVINYTRQHSSMTHLLATFGSFVFFFSSRRRHTRSTRDWSSDVCSSDLTHCPGLSPSTATARLWPHTASSPPTKAARIRQRVRSEERRVGKECRCRWSAYH